MRPAAIAAVIPLLLAPAELPCSAARCSCRPRPTEPSEFRAYVTGRLESSTAVFAGAVRRVGQDSTRRDFAEFRVTAAWKGVADTVVRIRLQAEPGMRSSCELGMEVDQEWLIFATLRGDGALHTGHCTLSALRSGAGTTLAALGTPSR